MAFAKNWWPCFAMWLWLNAVYAMAGFAAAVLVSITSIAVALLMSLDSRSKPAPTTYDRNEAINEHLHLRRQIERGEDAGQ